MLRQDVPTATRTVEQRERPDEREHLADQALGVVLVLAAVRAGVGEVVADAVAAQAALAVHVARPRLRALLGTGEQPAHRTCSVGDRADRQGVAGEPDIGAAGRALARRATAPAA